MRAVSRKRTLRALYSVSELASLANMHRNRIDRLLRAAGVEFVMSGSSKLVPSSEISKKLPAVWESIRLLEFERESVRR